MEKTAGRQRLSSLVDDGSFDELSGGVSARVVDFPLPRPYAVTVERAEQASGESEAVVTGLASIGGRRVGIATFDFRFLGGTLGVNTGRKVADAFNAARERQLPFVLVTASGGVRVQEGLLALFQMAAVAAAAERHRAAGLLQITVLDDPSYGGVPAGFGFAADVLITEPSARFGFAGGRVAGSLVGGATSGHKRVSPTAVVDAVLPRDEQRQYLVRLLGVTAGQRDPGLLAPEPVPRPLFLVMDAVDGAVALNGERRGGDPNGIATGLSTVDGHPFAWVVLGHDASGSAGAPGPNAYAKARRHLELAGRLDLPVVTVIDTTGADGSTQAEQGHVGGEISLTLATFVSLSVPTLCVIAGVGGSGGAMALAAADWLVFAPEATFHVLPPAAAIALLSPEPSQVDDLVRLLDVSAQDHLRSGLADEVVAITERSAGRDLLVRFLSEPPTPGVRAERWGST